MRHTLQLSLGSEHNLAEMTRMTERIVPLLCSNNHTAREIVPSVADSLRAFDCENAIFHPIFLFIERSDHFDNVISNFHSTKIIQKGEKRNEKAQKNESRQKTALADKIIDLKFLSIQKNTQNWLRKDGVITERDNVKFVSNKHLPVCYVTLCRQKCMNFWLLTENEPEKIAPVKLNYNIIPVDHLIHEWKTNGFSSAANLFMLICTEGQAVIDTLEETNKKTKSRKAKSPLTLLDEVPANIEEILANLSEHDQIEDLIDDTLSYD